MDQKWHNLATIITIVTFPITITSLSATFNFSPTSVELPTLPFGGAIKILLFIVGTVIFAVAFSYWYKIFDVSKNYSRFFLIPVLSFLSSAQSFAFLQILGADVDANSFVFPLGMSVALLLETWYLLKQSHREMLILIGANALFFTVFAIVIALESLPSESLSFDPILSFSVFLSLFIIFGLILVGFCKEMGIGEGVSQEDQSE